MAFLPCERRTTLVGVQKLKFAVGAAIVLGALVWLGFSGYEQSKTYYVTLTELRTRGEPAHSRRLRVAGEVLPGSFRRQSTRISFTLCEGDYKLKVIYTGSEPIPDTLVDNAQAIVTGSLSSENTFVAQQVQAKCASKYEALPPEAPTEEPAPTRTESSF